MPTEGATPRASQTAQTMCELSLAPIDDALLRDRDLRLDAALKAVPARLGYCEVWLRDEKMDIDCDLVE